MIDSVENFFLLVPLQKKNKTPKRNILDIHPPRRHEKTAKHPSKVTTTGPCPKPTMSGDVSRVAKSQVTWDPNSDSICPKRELGVL